MKNYKKLSILLLAALMLTVSAAACENGKDDSSSASSQETSKVLVLSDDTEESKAADTEESNASDGTDLIGKWVVKLDEEKFDEAFSSYTEEQKNQSKALIALMEMSYEFKSDGNVTCSMMGQSIDSKWSQDGNTIKVEAVKKETSSGHVSMEGPTFMIEGDKLVPVSEENTMKSVYFVKE